MWPDASMWAKACHSYSGQNARCVKAGQEQPEAGLLKKRKVGADKGKGKAKEVKAKLEFGFRKVVEELQGLRQEQWEFQLDFQNSHWIGVQMASTIVEVASHINDLAYLLIPEEKEDELENGLQEEEEEKALEKTPEMEVVEGGEGAGSSSSARGSENDGEETLH